MLYLGERNVLRELRDGAPWMYGLDIVYRSRCRRWWQRVRYGVVHVWLIRLCEQGYVQDRLEPEEAWRTKTRRLPVLGSRPPRRRQFTLTTVGRQIAENL